MNRLLRNILEKIVVIAAGRKVIRAEAFYRFTARRHGIEYIGEFERHGLVLFQDPITGSSFAIREGEPVESGIRRVRSRFGVTA